ncbi:hypothetical protein ACQEU3_25335 [Spirillospora sp. CA-253888]
MRLPGPGTSWLLVDAALLYDAARAWEARHGAGTAAAAAARAVADLIAAALDEDPMALWRIALHQVSAQLRGRNLTTLARLAQAARDLGVVSDEADQLAAGIAAASQGPSPADVEALLAAWHDGLPRTAARLAGAVPADRVTDHLLAAFLAEITASDAEVNTLLADAARAERAGDAESAAAAYGRAVRLAADDPAAAEGLARCAPPPPAELSATATGDAVRLEWKPSAATAGEITYRVVRRAGPVADELAVEPDATGLLDAEPPIGEPFTYEVRAVRDGVAVSAPLALVEPLRIAPEVADLTLTAVRGGVRGRWTKPRRAAAVRVEHLVPDTGDEHSAGRPDGHRVVEVPTAPDGFHDTDVPARGLCLYRVRCGYRTASGLLWTEGVAGMVAVEPWPWPVEDVAWTPRPDGAGVRVTWSPSRQGQDAGRTVVIGSAGPAPPPGTDLPVTDLEALGTIMASATAGARSADVPLPGPGLRHLVLVTVRDERAVTGPAQAVDVLPAVTGLRADHDGTQVRLAWQWPPGITQVRLRWGAADTPPSERLVTHDAYRRRHVAVPAAPALLRCTVTPVSPHPDALAVATAAEVEVSPGWDVAYQVSHRRRLVRRKADRATWTLHLEVSGPVPPHSEFVLVARPGTLRPTRPDQGEPVLRVPAAELARDGPATWELDPARLRPPCYLLGFVTGPDAAAARIAHPRPDQLTVR